MPKKSIIAILVRLRMPFFNTKFDSARLRHTDTTMLFLAASLAAQLGIHALLYPQPPHGTTTRRRPKFSSLLAAASASTTARHDIAIIGAGPGGLSLAAACSKRGLNIAVIDPAINTPWPNNYGVWVDEVSGYTKIEKYCFLY